jgi:hypothetical protein
MFLILIQSRERPDGAVDMLAQPDAIAGAGE